MNTLALLISLTGLIVLILGITVYFYKLIQNKVPKTPIGLFFSIFVATTSAIYGLYLSIPNEIINVLPIAVPAILSIIISSLFLFVFMNKKTPLGNIKVKIGDSIIPFQSTSAQGHAFSQEDLKNKRILLKFFRGSWCPYCSRELTMFDEMQSDFNKYNVEVIALSGDSVEEAMAHIKRDNLGLKLLADPQLDVVKKYGVEHHKALGADSQDVMTVFDLPFPKLNQLKFKSMSIPTSLLIDENGIIRWIDQSEDYRLRASNKRIVAALEECFNGK
jgi:peroxiredoxin